MAICNTKNLENYPYSDITFVRIAQLSSLIKKYSIKYDVPALAIAGSIADEYNTMHGIGSWWDWLQDHFFLAKLVPNALMEWGNRRPAIQSKWLNPVKHDLGIGNIKIETAKKICSRCQSILEPCIKNWSELIDYIESDIGTVTIAALVIKEAKNKLQKYVEGYSNAQKEAVYITYYKQGPLFVSRYLERVKKEKTNGINPGEGCRVYFQRKRFLQTLGLSE